MAWHKFICKIRALVLLLMVITQNVIFPPIYVFWFIIMQPIKLISISYFWKLEGILFDCYLSIVSSWPELAGHKIYWIGDDWKKCINNETLVMANHRSPNDIGVLMRHFHGSNLIYSKANWIMDWILQFSNFGIVAKLHGDFFLMQSPDAKKFSKLLQHNVNEVVNKQSVLLQHNILTNFNARGHKWIILFPEGGFYRNRLAGSQRFAQKNNLPILKQVCLPRDGCFKTIVNTLGLEITDYKEDLYNPRGERNIKFPNATPLKWIMDVTIAYKSPMSIFEFIFGYDGPKKIFIYTRVKLATDIIDKTNQPEKWNTVQTNWLQNLYIEKDKILIDFYKNGSFFNNNNPSAKENITPFIWSQLYWTHIFVAGSWYLVYIICCLLFNLI